MLTGRLALLRDLVAGNGSIADIGSGHGRLAAALALAGARVIATECSPGTVASLRLQLIRSRAVVEVRLGDGLAPIGPGEVEVAVIAGMGGRRMVAILEACSSLPGWLVLQPQRDLDMVLDFVTTRGYAAERVSIVERGHRYEVVKVRTL
ncbi:MAG: tRNA (adenine(22)-N(1))-methyltransferase TrmK [Candidatus Dormibacteria bacterium]